MSNSTAAYNSSIDGAQDVQHQQDATILAPEARSQSRASSTGSTSTQWPSAPTSPKSSEEEEEVTHLQEILDRALVHDPFSSHPEVTAHLKSNTDIYCQQAAQKIYDADVLLVVTGAGFSADSGLATYADVADIEAYRSRGWSYRGLCKPPTFADFSCLGIGKDGEENAATMVKAVDGKQNDAMHNGNGTELEKMECKNDSDSGNDSDNDYHRELYYREHNIAKLPDEDDIDHPKYFYGFWGQCCNDYRRVKPHEGYDIVARWGRDKNYVSKKDHDHESASGVDEDSVSKNENHEGNTSVAAHELRNITHVLEQGGGDDSDSSESFHFKEDDEEEPYYVSPNERAGAFFVFTSNVDAHSFDVFGSHEIRECHGNVELWQCHNFACGTNDTLGDGGSLNGIDGSTGGGGDDDNSNEGKQPQQQTWQRRLWRLPMDHHFLVDNSMGAPYSKTQLEKRAVEMAAGEAESSAVAPSSSPPALKRRKSSMQDDCNTNSDKGKTCGTGDESGSNACASTNNNDTLDTATALGGLMEDTLRSHLEKGVSKNDTKYHSDTPAHVGDVHGKPRIFPLRHMYPPTTADSTNNEQDFYLPISANENWPRCPRCQQAARPAVLMFEDLDWVYNLKQERRWQMWCQSLLKLCKRRSRADIGLGSDSASTVSDTNMSEKGWEDVSEPSTEQKTDHTAKVASSTPPAVSEQKDTPTYPSSPQSSIQPKSPLKVAILEVGCGYNVPTCRVIAERLVGELTIRGGDATLIRINPSHPEPDDHSVEDSVISIMERGLMALKMIDGHYGDLVKGGSVN
ncbi:hypothetical protein ACHAXR_009914 [Thalassiosira sp. AJA248-18]